MQYDKEVIDGLCSRFDLLDYASQSLDLEKSSNLYAAHCPLHIDKTPSLKIYPDSQSWYCFSCHKGGNIINWLMDIEHLSFEQSVNKVGAVSGIDVHRLKKCTSLKFFKDTAKLNYIAKKVNHNYLSDNEIEKYSKEYPQEWIDEGISERSMDKFDVRVDHHSNRIVYPIKSYPDGKILSIKGRTRYKNFKMMRIPKYISYNKIDTMDTFVCLYENIENIRRKNEVIIFEGIKSCMKAWEWGYDNAIAAETSNLNPSQIRLLIELQIKNIVIAFDSDVLLEKIFKTTKKLRQFTNVYVVYDNARLLPEKSAPCDMGRDVWERLYNNRKKVM